MLEPAKAEGGSLASAVQSGVSLGLDRCGCLRLTVACAGEVSISMDDQYYFSDVVIDFFTDLTHP